MRNCFIGLLLFFLAGGSALAQIAPFDLTGGATTKSSRGNVKLLFFVDDSYSMANHSAKLRALADHLAKKMRKRKCIKMQAGVVFQGHYESGNRGDRLFVYKGKIEGDERNKWGSRIKEVLEHPAKYLPISRQPELLRHLQARLNIALNLSTAAEAEVIADHALTTLEEEIKKGSFANTEAVIAFVVTDVIVGSDSAAQTQMQRLRRIQQTLGKTKLRFINFAVDPDAAKITCRFVDTDNRCNIDFSHVPQMQHQMGLMNSRDIQKHCAAGDLGYNFDVDLLKNFSRTTNGMFIDICRSNNKEAFAGVVDKIMAATSCMLTM